MTKFKFSFLRVNEQEAVNLSECKHSLNLFITVTSIHPLKPPVLSPAGSFPASTIVCPLPLKPQILKLKHTVAPFMTNLKLRILTSSMAYTVTPTVQATVYAC